MSLSVTVTRDDEDFEIIADLIFHKAHRGARDSCGGVPGAGPPLEPDEPATIEIDRTTDAAGNDIEISKREEEQILEAAWEQHNKF